MKEKSLFFSVLFIIIFVIFFGCSQTSSSDSPENLGSPADYFPMETGCKWEYEIIIGEVEPLQYRITHWPLGEKNVTYATRSRFLPLLYDKKNNRKYNLSFIVKGKVNNAGPYAWNPVELKIEKDDLGVFEGAEKVFFVRTEDYSLVMAVSLYSPNSPGAPAGSWGNWGQENGYSEKIVFFAEAPMIAKSITDSDSLLFLGKESGKLHYVRQVLAQEKNKGEISGLDAGFTEDMWYSKGKGLERLEQKINGKTSMTWKLINFSRY